MRVKVVTFSNYSGEAGRYIPPHTLYPLHRPHSLPCHVSRFSPLLVLPSILLPTQSSLMHSPSSPPLPSQALISLSLPSVPCHIPFSPATTNYHVPLLVHLPHRLPTSLLYYLPSPVILPSHAFSFPSLHKPFLLCLPPYPCYTTTSTLSRLPCHDPFSTLVVCLLHPSSTLPPITPLSCPSLPTTTTPA